MLMNKLKFVLWSCVLIIKLFSYATAVKSYGPCITPNRIAANCINLEDCKYLYEVLTAQYISESDSRFLRASQCGYVNQTVLICCPAHHVGESIKATTPKTNKLLPSYPHCGLTLSNRIYGGTQAEIGEFPWLALIEFTDISTNKRVHYCGGTLINERYVLTAAHCVDEDELPANWRVSAVRLGEWDINKNPDCDGSTCAPPHQDINIVEIISHPNYRQPNEPNDIALLRLEQPANLNNFVMPICLPSAASSRDDSFVNASMDVAGWGNTERVLQSPVLLKTAVTVKELSECQKKYKQLLNGISVDTTQLCAGGTNGHDSCRGDSGGPLMFLDQINHRAAYNLIGIVSFGPRPCGTEGWPGVYTRVDAFMDWIEEQIKP